MSYTAQGILLYVHHARQGSTQSKSSMRDKEHRKSGTAQALTCRQSTWARPEHTPHIGQSQNHHQTQRAESHICCCQHLSTHDSASSGNLQSRGCTVSKHPQKVRDLRLALPRVTVSTYHGVNLVACFFLALVHSFSQLGKKQL